MQMVVMIYYLKYKIGRYTLLCNINIHNNLFPLSLVTMEKCSCEFYVLLTVYLGIILFNL